MYTDKLNGGIDNLLKDFDGREPSGILSTDLTDEDLLLIYEMGYKLYLSRDYEQSEVVFNRLILARPMEVRYWKARASSLQMLCRYNDAILHWSVCCILDNLSPDYHLHAAEALFSTKDKKNGLMALDAAEQRFPSKVQLNKVSLLREIWDK